MASKIIDCFIFYNELDLLNYRLNILSDVVDYFVIVESTHTHVGKEKPLYFHENKDLFENFKNKIIHVIVDDMPYKYPNINFNNKEQWKNENFQRDAISRGIDRIPNLNNNDFLIISDLDEIPDPDTLDKIKKHEIIVNINSLVMDMYYYNLITKFDMKWNYCKILSYMKYKELNVTCCKIRESNNSAILKGGWHLSYFGDAAFIKNKIEHFGHQELNTPNFTDLSKIEEKINTSSYLYNTSENPKRIEIKDNLYLPKEYTKYLIRFVPSN